MVVRIAPKIRRSQIVWGPLIGIKGVSDPQETRAKWSLYRSYRMGVGSRDPKTGMPGPRSLGWVAWLSARNTPLPTCVTMPNLVVLCQTARAYARRSAEILGPAAPASRPAFQGHSRSSELTWIDRLMTSY